MKKKMGKKNVILIGLFSAIIMGFFSPVLANESQDMKSQLKLADDITTETLVGPGSLEITTGKDILMSFGATVRVIPTLESDWDFGLEDNAQGGFLFGGLGPNFFKDHANEGGWVNNGYIRNEDKIYFNALPKDRKWSFYAALEYDSVWETSSVDGRGGKSSDSSNFGLERIEGTMLLPYGLRLHAGFNIWNLDGIDGGGLVYVDDNPGLWFTGGHDALSFNVGFFKLGENDFQTGPGALNDDVDDDRDLYAAQMTWKLDDNKKVKFLYAYDRIRNAPAIDFMGALTQGQMGVDSGKMAKTDSHHVGAYYIGNYNNLNLFLEGVWQFGSADDTGLGALGKEENYDVSAFALAADVSFQFKGLLTDFPLKPHVGIIYTTGDNDPNDDKLEGYTGVVSCQRFAQRWGGENTIIGDNNWVLGTPIYSYIPEMYGNGTPVATGGISNLTGFGNGRGDNPGLTMISLGLTVAPKPFIIYKTNVNMFRWNEDFEVSNFVNPTLGSTEVSAGYVGTEWDNELTIAASKNTFIKAQASFFFPGEGVEDVTSALAGGNASDEVACRLAAELIWNF